MLKEKGPGAVVELSAEESDTMPDVPKNFNEVVGAVSQRLKMTE